MPRSVTYAGTKDKIMKLDRRIIFL